MTESEWLTCANPVQMVEALEDKGSDRKFRLLGCAGCRSLRSPVADRESQHKIDVAEAYADGWVIREALIEAANVVWQTLYRNGWRNPHESFPPIHYLSEPHSFDAGLRTLAACVDLEASERSLRFWAWEKQKRRRAFYVALVRDIFGNPFRPVAFSSDWRTDTAVTLARQMYESREFSAMPILADSLQDAGCDNDDILNHCRDTSLTHVRGCWVVDLVLGKE